VGGAIQPLADGERRGVRPQRRFLPVRLRQWLPHRALPVAGADGVPLGEATARQHMVLQRKVTVHTSRALPPGVHFSWDGNGLIR